MPSLDDDSGRCPKCGGQLPTDVPAPALCPFCLYHLGLHEDRASAGTVPQLPPTDTLIIDPPPQHPDRIGPYRILEPIKEGGMGIVYLAEQQEPIHRRVALKLIKLGLNSREVVARFESERQALALMDHPNIARVFDAGTATDGRPYFVMEYVPGVRITQYCDDHRLSNRERVRLFTQVCAAVQHAHQKGIIHRDLKPSNVLVMQQDGQPVPKIIDFGVAKALNQTLTQQTVFTQLGRIVGTIEYMSPEQAEGILDIDATSDIYAMGVLLYELLVGALPFDSKLLRQAGYAEMQRVIREDDPARPSTRLSGLGDTAREVARLRQTDLSSLERELRGDLDWITMKAMDKGRARRYASASEFASDLTRHLNDEPVVARPPSAGYRLSKFVKKHKVAAFTSLTIVSALATALAISTIYYSRAERARRDFQLESYVANLRAADLHLRSGEIAEARRRLASADPALRGWEWRHLFLKSDASTRMLASGGTPISLGISADGQRVFWLSSFGVLREANARTLEELPLLVRPATDGTADKPPEYIVGVSPDGTRYASVAWAFYGARLSREDGDATFWEFLRGAVSPKDENTILIKQVSTGEIVGRLSSPIGGERRGASFSPAIPRAGGVGGSGLPAIVVFSRDNRYAAIWRQSEFSEPLIRIHDIASGQAIAEFRGHENRIAAGEFSPDAAYFLSGSYDGTIRLWNLKTRTADRVMTHEGSVWAVTFSPDGRLIASGGADTVIKLWDLNGTPVRTLRGHTGGVQALAFAPDGKRLASASADRSIRIWNTASEAAPVVFLGHPQFVTGLTFTLDGLLVSGGMDNTIRLWDLDRAAPSIAKPLSPAQFRRLAVTQDGRRVGVEGSDGVVRVWDRLRSSGETTFKGHGPDMGDLAFTSDGTGLASVSSKDVQVWDPSTGQRISTRVWPEPLYRMALLPDGRRVIELTQKGAVRIWSVEGSDPPVDLAPGFDRPSDGSLEMVASSNNNQRVAIGNSGQLGVWDLTRRTRLQLIDLHRLDIVMQMGVVVLSPDGSRVATGHIDGTVRLWDVASGRLLFQYSAHDGPVGSLAFDSTGTRVVSASPRDRNIRIWLAQPRTSGIEGVHGPLQFGEPLLSLEQDAGVDGLRVSGDGSVIVQLNRVGLRLWSAESAYAADPRLAADLLRETRGTSVEAIAALATDSSLTPAVQHDVLEYLTAQGDNIGALEFRAWHIVSVPGHSSEDYALALALARSAMQLAPWLPGGSVSTTLGAAYYRLGRYTEALASLQTAERLHSETQPDLATLAFIAMANQRLGRTDVARRVLERLEDFVKTGQILGGSARNVPVPALAREAASVVRGAALPPK